MTSTEQLLKFENIPPILYISQEVLEVAVRRPNELRITFQPAYTNFKFIVQIFVKMKRDIFWHLIQAFLTDY